MTRTTTRSTDAARWTLLVLVATALVTAYLARPLSGRHRSFAPPTVSILETALLSFLSSLRHLSSSSSTFIFLFGGGTVTRAISDCFSPSDPVHFALAGPGHDEDDPPRILRRLTPSGREAGRYSNRFSLRVSLEIPLNDIEGGRGDDDYAYAAVAGELVIVTDTEVTATTAPDGRLPQVELIYQEVTSRAVATTETAAAPSSREKEREEESGEPRWVEVCHGTTTTRARFTAAGTAAARSGLRVPPRRSLLPMSGGHPETPPFTDDPRCAFLLSAVAGMASPNSGDTINPAVVPPTTAGTLADRYLEAIPVAHAIRPGDSWHVILPPRRRVWIDAGGEDGIEEAGPGADGPSLTGVATFLGYQAASSACGPNKVGQAPRDIAVIQVRGTESIEGGEWLEAIHATVREGAGQPPPSLAVVSLVPGDADVVATMYFDVTTQRVRHVAVDHTFVLHATLSGGGTTAIPVRGTAVLETWRLGTPRSLVASVAGFPRVHFSN